MPKPKPKTVVVRVTQEDIFNGVSGPQSCPVALAMRRTLGLERDDVGVGGLSMRIKEQRFESPSAVERFVFRFDNGKPVTPFQFTIRLP